MEDVKQMNPQHNEFKFPQIKPHPWNKVKLNPQSCGERDRLLINY